MARPVAQVGGESLPETFTQMDKDLETIGAHCQYTYCNQLDFLPFRCESCRSTFCLEHRSEHSHKCAKAGAWARASKQAASSLSTDSHSLHASSKPTLTTGTQCSDPHCKTYINTLNAVGVHCQSCRREYCLKHRMGEDHECAKLQATLGGASANSGVATQADRARQALGRLRAWSKEKQSSVLSSSKNRSTSSATSRLLAINKLKQAAKGDEKIATEKRIYLFVEAEASTTTSKLPKGQFWYNREWSVGRMLDAAATALQVQNLNNRVEGEEERLRIFHVEAGRLLDFSEKVHDTCVNGNTIVLLRGVGPTVT